MGFCVKRRVSVRTVARCPPALYGAGARRRIRQFCRAHTAVPARAVLAPIQRCDARFDLVAIDRTTVQSRRSRTHRRSQRTARRELSATRRVAPSHTAHDDAQRVARAEKASASQRSGVHTHSARRCCAAHRLSALSLRRRNCLVMRTERLVQLSPRACADVHNPWYGSASCGDQHGGTRSGAVNIRSAAQQCRPSPSPCFFRRVRRRCDPYPAVARGGVAPAATQDEGRAKRRAAGAHAAAQCASQGHRSHSTVGSVRADSIAAVDRLDDPSFLPLHPISRIAPA